MEENNTVENNLDDILKTWELWTWEVIITIK